MLSASTVKSETTYDPNYFAGKNLFNRPESGGGGEGWSAATKDNTRVTLSFFLFYFFLFFFFFFFFFSFFYNKYLVGRMPVCPKGFDAPGNLAPFSCLLFDTDEKEANNILC